MDTRTPDEQILKELQFDSEQRVVGVMAEVRHVADSSSACKLEWIMALQQLSCEMLQEFNESELIDALAVSSHIEIS